MSVGVPDHGVEQQQGEREQAAWGFENAKSHEPRWPATLAVLAALALYAPLPARYTAGPPWVLPALELAVLIPLNVTSPRITRSSHSHALGFILIGAVSAANVYALYVLVEDLLQKHATGFQHGLNGRALLTAAVQVWLTNVLVFGLWYWMLDRGGPGQRADHRHRQPDFLFPQMSNPESAPKHWSPSFMDYLYLSVTNSAAFSPTDTMPLTPWAKMLMLAQSLISLLTIALVAARAVNILG